MDLQSQIEVAEKHDRLMDTMFMLFELYHEPMAIVSKATGDVIERNNASEGMEVKGDTILENEEFKVIQLSND